MSEEEQQEQIIVAQLGTELDILGYGRFDNEKLSNIKSSQETPDTFRSYIYFGTVTRIIQAKARGVPMSFAEAMSTTALKMNISIGGRGRRDLLYAEQVKRGVGISLSKEIPKPTMWDKLFRRKVVEDYERQEAENMELE